MNQCPTCHTKVFEIKGHLIPIYEKEIISKLSHENELLTAQVVALSCELEAIKRVAKTLDLTRGMYEDRRDT